jgi:hypothetical protein
VTGGFSRTSQPVKLVNQSILVIIIIIIIIIINDDDKIKDDEIIWAYSMHERDEE